MNNKIYAFLIILMLITPVWAQTGEPAGKSRLLTPNIQTVVKEPADKSSLLIQNIQTAVSSKISYQGILKDSTGNPINATVNMSLQLYNASIGGSMLWSETKSVQVNRGLFNTNLGDVTPLNVAQFNQGLWLEIVVEGETLTPRQQLLGSPYAFSLIPGAKVSGGVWDPGLTVSNDWWHGIEGRSVDGDGVRGISTGGGIADNGVYGETSSTFYAEAGVYGRSTDIASGVIGTSTKGTGVYGEHTDPTFTSPGVYGKNTGSGAGVLGDSYDSYPGGAIVARNYGGGYGVEGISTNSYGGYFTGYDGVYSSSSGAYGYGLTGTSNYLGIYGSGNSYGGYFYSPDGYGLAAVSNGIDSWDDGINSYSNYGSGVYASSSNGYGLEVSSYGTDSWDDGINSYSDYGSGVYSYSNNANGVMGVSNGNWYYGGSFQSNNGDGLYARGAPVYGWAAYLDGTIYVNGDIWASGTKYFVEDHPTDPTKQISYISLEGGEAGVYVRGSAQLNNGVATVKLPEDFGLVANETGLTVQVTLTQEAKGLYVVSKSPTEIVVKELGGGTSSATFDYFVNGIRKGYENFTSIQDKDTKHSNPGVTQAQVKRTTADHKRNAEKPKKPTEGR